MEELFRFIKDVVDIFGLTGSIIIAIVLAALIALLKSLASDR